MNDPAAVGRRAVKWSEMSIREAAAESLRLYFRPARSPLFWVLVALTVAAWPVIVRFIPEVEGP